MSDDHTYLFQFAITNTTILPCSGFLESMRPDSEIAKKQIERTNKSCTFGRHSEWRRLSIGGTCQSRSVDGLDVPAAYNAESKEGTSLKLL